MRLTLKKLKLCYEENEYECTIPCSLFSVLSEENALPHPYKDDNEKAYISAAEKDCSFVAEFDFKADKEKIYAITFGSIDTIATIFLNGKFIGETRNAFCPFTAEVSGKDFADGENVLKVHIFSPVEYARNKAKKHYVDSQMDTPKVGLFGRAAMRKPQYSFGWDWGASLPDSGVYEPITIEEKRTKPDDFVIRQIHKDGKVKLLLSSAIKCKCTLYSPENECVGETYTGNGYGEITVQNPQLWWCNNLGEQPLYTLNIEYKDEHSGETICESRTLGLRTIEISQNTDQWGREFAFVINGKKIFACGANYIPEDQIIPWYDEKKTEELIRNCKAANFNMIRVWGGGIYPSNKFYELCDKAGIIVWQDFMFACQAVYLTEEFTADVKKEIEYQVKRIAFHPSIGLLCGNNENEDMVADRRLRSYGHLSHRPCLDATDYLKLFEHIIPDICEKFAPDVFYWGCSPSSGGGFYMSENENFGDSHIWNCWEKSKPLNAYKEHFPRFCSEFGFLSYPSLQTIESFSDRKIESICDKAVQSHFKRLVYCESIQDSLEEWNTQMFGKTESLQEKTENSQILQGRMLKGFIEHMRINRGRCMGALYWQLNDSWQSVSWSTIDYFGNRKASMDYVARAFQPVICAAEITDGTAKAYVVNDLPKDFNGELQVFITTDAGDEVFSVKKKVRAGAFSSEKIFEIDCVPFFEGKNNKSLGLILTDKKGNTVSFNSESFVPQNSFEFFSEGHSEKQKANYAEIKNINNRLNLLCAERKQIDFCDAVQASICIDSVRK